MLADLSESPQHPIAGEVPKAVIDRLEMIQVAHDHAHLAPGAFGQDQLPPERVLEKPAVRAGHH